MRAVTDLIYRNLIYVIDGTNFGYTSLVFFCCLVFFLCVFWALRSQRSKRNWILIANLVFYVWAGGVPGVLIVIATALIVYLASCWMTTVYQGFEKETDGLSMKEKNEILPAYKKKTKKILYFALFLILAMWIYVKVGKLLDMDTMESIQDLFAGKGILVPLGISYYSLSAIGYLLDVYWRKTKAERNFLSLFTVMTYFPHIVQGPISKYSKLLKQMNDLPRFDYQRVCFGLQRMLWGYIQKMVIADRLALYTAAVFAEPADFAGVEILLAVILCVFQLYADFNGCMDIVTGISEAVGINLDVNFRQPFFSKSAPEFWRRWHITLGAWMKEYIYLPISTNPKFMRWIWDMKKNGRAKISSVLKTLVPTFAVWLLTGLWHGTGADYVIWGLYWCLLITLSSEMKPLTDKLSEELGIRTERRWFRIWQSLRTCILFGIGRMFSVAGGLEGCALLWKQLLKEARLWTLFDGSLYTYGLDQKDFYVALLGIIIILIVDMVHERGGHIRERLAKQPLAARWFIYYAAMFAIVILGIYGTAYDAASFVYGAF